MLDPSVIQKITKMIFESINVVNQSLTRVDCKAALSVSLSKQLCRDPDLLLIGCE